MIGKDDKYEKKNAYENFGLCKDLYTSEHFDKERNSSERAGA